MTQAINVSDWGRCATALAAGLTDTGVLIDPCWRAAIEQTLGICSSRSPEKRAAPHKGPPKILNLTHVNNPPGSAVTKGVFEDQAGARWYLFVSDRQRCGGPTDRRADGRSDRWWPDRAADRRRSRDPQLVGRNVHSPPPERGRRVGQRVCPRSPGAARPATPRRDRTAPAPLRTGTHSRRGSRTRRSPTRRPSRAARFAASVCAGYPLGMRTTERVTVTLPLEQAERLRRLADEGGAASISAYVSDAVRAQLDKDAALERLARLYTERGVSLQAEHHAWARHLLGLEADDPRAHAS